MSGPYGDPRAGRLLERYRQTFGGELIPVPVESIAEDLLGLHVEDSYEIGYSGMLFPARRRIVLSAAHERELGPRRRFTLAHEVGHWICHCLEGERAEEVFCRPVDVTEATDRDLEREANVFAAELIMPEPLVRKEWGGHPSVVDMAWRFQVSEPAMHWRLYNIGLTADRPA
jgi:Zn-dependent peptidase ImmA (M78 family)